MQLAIANMMVALTTAQSSAGNPIEQASKRNGRIFAAYILILVITALLIAVFTWLTWDSGNKLQDAIRHDADARIREASQGLEQLRHDNFELSGDLEKEKGKVAELQKEAADAKAAQQKVETDLAKQREITAKAELALVKLKQQVSPRHLDETQIKALATNLRKFLNKPGDVAISCIGGNPEPCAFAQELIKAVRAAGWTVTIFNRGLIVVGNPPSGLSIRTNSPHNQTAIALQRALRAIGLEASGSIAGPPNKDKVELLVGSKPLSQN